VDYFLVVTGGELLEGAYPDAHTHFIVRTLRPLGCRCVGSVIVDDQPNEIHRALHFATNAAALVLVTGGLGPTPNDITRETLADFTHIPLIESPEALDAIARRAGTTPDQLRPNLRRQALAPSHGSILSNPNGTAAGLVYETTSLTLVALPGPPRELQPMVRNELVPLLQRRFGIREFGASLTLRFVGAGQSLLDQTIKDHVAVDADVVVTSLFDGSRVDFTFALPGHADTDRTRLHQLGTAIREHLEPYFYADDGSTLEDVIVRRFASTRTRLALAEIGTAGHLAAALAANRGSTSILEGAFVLPTPSAITSILALDPGDSNRNTAAPGSMIELRGEALVRSLADALSRRLPGATAVTTGPLERNGDSTVVWIAVKPAAAAISVFQVPARDGTAASTITPILDRWRKLP
jgi:nicotinamide-nucleotide amidase